MSIFFRFSFFKNTKPRKFDPIPRFYEPDKEFLEDKLNYKRDESEKYSKIKANIRSNFRNSHTGFGVNRSGKRRNYNSNIRLVVILIFLIVITYILLIKYLPQIENLVK
jgi:cytoskeletal protein RodZ